MIVPARAPALSQSLDVQRIDERRRALIGLLRHPLLLANGPDADLFALVRRHADWLREWFARHAAWSLHIDAETARLRKVPADTRDPTRGVKDERSGRPFDRRRYVLLCLALAALESTDRQTTLGLMAEKVLGYAANDAELIDAGFAFDLQTRRDRRDLVQVTRLLLELGVLHRVDGDEESFVNRQGDALYDIRKSALAGMLSVRQAPSLIEAESLESRIASIIDEPTPDSDEARNQARRVRLMRRLLDDPVVYYDDLSSDERDYLNSQRPRLLATVEHDAGLVPEVRREGIALADETGASTDLGLPEEGTDGHLTLLLAEYLARRLREDGPRVVSRNSLERHTTELICENRSFWRKDVSEPGAARGLVQATLHHLAGLRLIDLTEHGVVPRPAVARYALDELCPTPVPMTLAEEPS